MPILIWVAGGGYGFSPWARGSGRHSAADGVRRGRGCSRRGCSCDEVAMPLTLLGWRRGAGMCIWLVGEGCAAMQDPLVSVR